MKNLVFGLVAAAAMLTANVCQGDYETAKHAGWDVQVDLGSSAGNFFVSGPTVVYDNLAAPSAVSAATSSADLNATWGDRITTTDTGYFDRIGVSVFNSTTGGNTLPILTATLNFGIYDAATFDATNLANNTALFAFTGNVNFGAGLNPGFFTTVTFTGLNAFFGDAATAFSTTNQNFMVTQRLSNITGGSLRAGVVTFTVDNIGSQYLANDNFYRNFPATPVSGYVAFGAPTSNRLAQNFGVTIPEPASGAAILLVGIAGVFARRRR